MLLVPVVILVAQRTGLSLMKVGIPALAGLSVLHGLVPPHPGPLTAIGLLDADLGPHPDLRHPHRDPHGIVAGPLLARFVDQWVPKSADDLTLFGAASKAGGAAARTGGAEPCRRRRRADREGGVAVDTVRPATADERRDTSADSG